MQRTVPDSDAGLARLVLPRHRASASRGLAYSMTVAGAVLILCTLFVPGYAGGTALTVGATLAIGALAGSAGLVCWRHPRFAVLPDVVLAGMPVLAVLLVATLDLVTDDPSPAAQLYFVWPALYAAAYLRRPTVVAVLLLTVVSDAAVNLALAPSGDPVSNIISMITVLTMASVIIVKLRERADELVDALETQALTDPLTGLPNRRAFTREIERAVAHSRRTGAPLALITIDVDRFKLINDTAGHASGDAALRTVADVLRAVVRASDIVARIGGDEFAVLAETGRDGAWRVAGALRTGMAGAVEFPGGPPTLSIGVACMPADADAVTTLLAASDAALYQAKAAGRDQISGPPRPAEAGTEPAGPGAGTVKRYGPGTGGTDRAVA